MEIRIVDINDASHPLKTGEMEIDRVNNVMYVGGQFGVADIDFRGLVNVLCVNLQINRLPVYYLGLILKAFINVNANINFTNTSIYEVTAIIYNLYATDISLNIERVK